MTENQYMVKQNERCLFFLKKDDELKEFDRLLKSGYKSN